MIPRTSRAAARAAPFAATTLAGDLDDGRKLQTEGRYAEALEKFKAAAAADPASADAALGLSQALAGLGRYDEAANVAREALRTHPDHLPLLLAKARAYLLVADKLAQDDPGDAQPIIANAADADAAIKAILAKDPKHVEARVLKARVLQHSADIDGAVTLLEQVVADAPGDFDANWELGQHWFRQGGQQNKVLGHWAKAEKYFAAAAAADPKSGMAALNVAHAKAWQQKPAPELAAAYLRAAELMPGSIGALKGLYQWGRTADAAANAATFERLCKANPKNLDLRLYHAYALKDAKRFEEAAKVLRAAREDHPGEPWVAYNLGDVYLSWGKTSEAIDSYVEFVSLHKADLSQTVYDRLAYSIPISTAGVTTPQREKLWEALWKHYPTNAGAANNAGLFFRDTERDDKKSLEWYLRAARVATDDPCIQNDTGLIYHYHMKDAKSAEPYYRRAIEIGETQGLDWSGGQGLDMGYRDAINNLGKLLVEGERWKELGEFVEKNVPEGHPSRDEWLAKAKGRK